MPLDYRDLGTGKTRQEAEREREFNEAIAAKDTEIAGLQALVTQIREDSAREGDMLMLALVETQMNTVDRLEQADDLALALIELQLNPGGGV